MSSENNRLERPTVKCLVWDLDDTLWHGTLLEDKQVSLRSGVADLIQTLDQRGILHSIASRNDPDLALAQLAQFGLKDYFLYPQINWNSKSSSIQAIAQALNIGLDSLAFVDDQPFERAEVASVFPEVLCLDTADLAHLADQPAFTPRFITEDSARRREMYLANAARETAEATYSGPAEAFLASLDMVFTIEQADENDLQRAEELTVRTNQLNSTGHTYDYQELNTFRHSPDHLLLIASLDDKFGSYGRIGLALIEYQSKLWTLKLLLMSCRVLSRGVGSVMLYQIMRLANSAGVRLQAEFVQNGRNRQMFITYRFAGFYEVARNGDSILLEHNLANLPNSPPYMKVMTTWPHD